MSYPVARLGTDPTGFFSPEVSLNNPIEVDDAIVLLLGAKASGTSKGELHGITRLEKLVFLLERETKSNEWLTEDAEFEAYNFGPFSQRVYQAVDTLSSAGLIRDSDSLGTDESDTWETTSKIDDISIDPYKTRDFEMTDLGWQYFEALTQELPEGALSEIENFKSRFASLPLKTLVRYVYQRYADYTTKSLIRDQVLGES